MRHLSHLAQRATGVLVRNRDRLPGPVNRLIDDVAKNPDGIASRLANVVLGGTSRSQIPAPTTVPDSMVRVLIGPTNYSGQGYLWARALELNDPAGGTGARNIGIELPGGFLFPADTSVPIAVYNASRRWQKSELAVATKFTHALIEAGRPLFGDLLGRSVAREVGELQKHGVSSALMSHGTDVRSPRQHLAQNIWSPFADDPLRDVLQAEADATRELISALALPVFVSTPDLLVDVPEAQWCPVVVDSARWQFRRELLDGRVPVVSHVPSMSPTKGTALIEPAVLALHRAGTIDYRRAQGVSSALMPALIGQADIVLDQFRIGSYGVAACEAMAAGRVVIGHVTPSVRRYILDSTGQKLPIIEADPDSLSRVLEELAASPDRIREAAAAGPTFVSAVHSGARSAAVLREYWIDRY